MLGVSQVPPNMDSEDIDLKDIRELLDDTSNLSSEGKKVLATKINKQAPPQFLYTHDTSFYDCLCGGPTPSNTDLIFGL
eukprot:9502027-Pyramimonas_sp.AAC.1